MSQREFELPDVSYSAPDIPDIEDYYECIMKKHDTSTDNPPIRIYVNKIENRITFRFKKRYYLELLTPETMKLLGSSKSKITKDQNVENMLYLKITQAVLVHCNIINNNY